MIEGMSISGDDDPGDLFTLSVTRQMVESEIALDAYMIAVDRSLDPFLLLTDERLEDFERDARDQPIYCDNGGGDCWGKSESLEEGSLTGAEGKRYSPDRFDAMISLGDPELTPGKLTVLATSFNQDSIGRYIILFRIGL
jgi:hypothetical protein